jgi:hypothetical protein
LPRTAHRGNSLQAFLHKDSDQHKAPLSKSNSSRPRICAICKTRIHAERETVYSLKTATTKQIWQTNLQILKKDFIREFTSIDSDQVHECITVYIHLQSSTRLNTATLHHNLSATLATKICFGPESRQLRNRTHRRS